MCTCRGMVNRKTGYCPIVLASHAVILFTASFDILQNDRAVTHRWQETCSGQYHQMGRSKVKNYDNGKLKKYRVMSEVFLFITKPHLKINCKSK